MIVKARGVNNTSILVDSLHSEENLLILLAVKWLKVAKLSAVNEQTAFFPLTDDIWLKQTTICQRSSDRQSPGRERATSNADWRKPTFPAIIGNQSCQFVPIADDI